MVGASSRLLFPLTNPISIRHHRSFALFRLPRGSSLTQSAAPSHLVHLCRRNSLIPMKFAQNFYSRATNNAFQENNHIAANDYHVSPSHPWPEWSRLLESLSVAGYFNADSNVEDEFVAKKNLSMEFVAAANSCLAFARDRPDILGWLPRKDIEVFIDEGYPFLFKSASETERRMRSFLQADGSNEARSVDLMKYILSYASNPAIYLERKIKEDTESSVRSLLQEMANLSYRSRASEQFQAVARDEQMPRNLGPNITMERGDWIRPNLLQEMANLSYGGRASGQFQAVARDEQMPRNLGPNITMERVDWMCPKCSFMNFARNTTCFKCKELRPQRQLTDGQWDCPQCNFFNYKRNAVCLKCGGRRPVPGQANTPSERQMIGSHYRNNYDDNGAPGGNKFRIATSVDHNLDQFHGNSIDRGQNDRNNGRPSIAMRSHSGYVPFVPSPGSPGQANTPSEGQMIGSHYRNNYDDNGVPGGNKFRIATSVDHNLDQFHGNSIDRGQNDRNNGRPSIAMRSHSGNVLFVPLPADLFTKKPEKATNEHSEEADESVKAGEYVQSRHTQDIDKEEKSERWFEKVKELHGVTGPTSAILQIMPVRKGENHFVDSKKIHQPFSLYPRQQAMEQGSTSSVVPFVPFPPDSFAKKDDQQQQPESTDLTMKPTDDISLSLSQENKNLVQGTRNQQMSGTDNLDSMSSIGTNTDSSNDQFRRNETRCDISNIGQQTPETPNVRSGWTGKSLEESAVTEADPLDMSEEAKAERWFRRVAYIKDISELSQIPDEDFPSIMPMRKGMNRFVVSKRKTPLERRLTSPQYRKNLRIMSSDPMKREGDDDN